MLSWTLLLHFEIAHHLAMLTIGITMRLVSAPNCVYVLFNLIMHTSSRIFRIPSKLPSAIDDCFINCVLGDSKKVFMGQHISVEGRILNKIAGAG